MTTWNSVVEYVRSNYKISDEGPDRVKLVFEVGDLRTQVVFLWRQALENGTEEWLQIESPIGKADGMDLRAVLEEVGTKVCGGAALIEGHLFIRQSMPLANLDINEFERPLALITATADRLERQFVGGDEF
ncbi:MAG TPA: hypothetical protein VGJ07_15730 [Rugosimonospora sp.]|jgi:hypothetical protein